MYCRKIVIISGQTKEYTDTKGILTLATEKEGITAKLSVYRLSPKPTEYKCVIACEGALYTYSLSTGDGIDVAFVTDLALTPTSKISVIIGVKESGKPIAYGSNSGMPMWESGLVRELQPLPAPIVTPIPTAVLTKKSEQDIELRSVVSSTHAAQPMEANARPLASGRDNLTDFERAQNLARSVYDDERVADYNFYSDSFEKRIDGGKYVARKEAAAASLDAWGGYNTVYRPRLRVEAREKKAEEAVPKYYLSVKPTLDALFRASTEEDVLNSALLGTRWVRVPYKERRYYCVGLVGSAPDYIGYAVPGTYELNPPRQLEDVSKWIPMSSEDPTGEGYWVMFQDAISGATVRIN